MKTASVRPRTGLRFTNGLQFKEFVTDVLWHLADDYEFVEDANAQFLIFGPYGPPPPPGNYVRIGYFCENVWPNLECCDWAFGMPYGEEVGSDRYCRIDWHGIRPEQLVRDLQSTATRPLPPRFCNFVFSNPVGFRESFFLALNRYRHVDAPGKSMNNMPSFDSDYRDDDKWVRKRKFLSQYKFTIAFENDSSCGYNTEKLTDAMLAGSIPIYLGNPEVGRHFNARSFINAHEYFPFRQNFLTRWTEKLGMTRWGRRERLPLRIQPRFRKAMRFFKFRLKYGFDFSALVAKIIELDQNESLYRTMLAEPLLHDNLPPSVEPLRRRWIQIFNSELPLQKL